MNIQQAIDKALERIRWNLRVAAIAASFSNRELGARFAAEHRKETPPSV